MRAKKETAILLFWNQRLHAEHSIIVVIDWSDQVFLLAYNKS